MACYVPDLIVAFMPCFFDVPERPILCWEESEGLQIWVIQKMEGELKGRDEESTVGL